MHDSNSSTVTETPTRQLVINPVNAFPAMTPTNNLSLLSIRNGVRPFATKSHLIAVTKRNVENMIKSDKVVIFSKSGCCHSEAAKRFFNDIRTKFTAIELDRREDGPFIQTHLACITGSPVTPRIYIVGKCIGGYYELITLHQNGALIRLLNNDA